MADLLPTGAVPLTVDFNYITNTTETAGTASTVSSGKAGIILGLVLIQVSTAASKVTRAVMVVNGQEIGSPLEADSSSPDSTSNAGDSQRYVRKVFYFPASQRPLLPPGATINVQIKNSSVTSLVTAHARIEAYEYTP